MPGVEHVVQPVGELDIANVPALREEWLRAVKEEQPGRFVFDLRAVTYLDSTALGAIVAVRLRQREHGGDVVVTNAGPAQVKLFRLTGLDLVIEINGQIPPVGQSGRPSGRWDGAEFGDDRPAS